MPVQGSFLRRHLPLMSPELAAQSYAMLVNPRGFTPEAKIGFLSLTLKNV
jgi:hypothetical protein